MKVGLIGLPETGKTTLYNALTRSTAAVHSFGAHSSEINLGTIPVPDERFDFAVQVCHPKKQVRATIEITDGGARVQIDQSKEKFGTDFFTGVRNMDALVLVLRAFTSDALPDPPGGIDPARDALKVMEELLIADLTVIENRMERLEKNRLMKRQTPGEAVEQQTLNKIKAHLDSLQPVRTLELTPDEERSVRSFAFVSGTPLILVANLGEDDIRADPAVTAGVRAVTNDNVCF